MRHLWKYVCLNYNSKNKYITDDNWKDRGEQCFVMTPIYGKSSYADPLNVMSFECLKEKTDK